MIDNTSPLLTDDEQCSHCQQNYTTQQYAELTCLTCGNGRNLQLSSTFRSVTESVTDTVSITHSHHASLSQGRRANIAVENSTEVMLEHGDQI